MRLTFAAGNVPAIPSHDDDILSNITIHRSPLSPTLGKEVVDDQNIVPDPALDALSPAVTAYKKRWHLAGADVRRKLDIDVTAVINTAVGRQIGFSPARAY